MEATPDNARSRPSGRSDEELIRAYAATRAEDAIAELIARHGPMVFATCWRILGDPHAAEDAAQVTFVILSRKAQRLASHPALGAWLYRTARHTARYTQRQYAIRRKHETRAAQDLAAARGVDPSAGDLQSHLDGALDRLPAKLRDAVVLRHLQGLSQEETARQLGCSVGAASMQVSRGLEKLRRHLARAGFAVTAVTLGALLDRIALGEPMAGGFAERTAALCAGKTALGGATASLLQGIATSRFWALAKGVVSAVLVTGAAAGGLWLGPGMFSRSVQPDPLAGSATSRPHGLSVPAGAYRMAVLDLTIDKRPIQLYAPMRDGKAVSALLVFMGKDETGRPVQERGIENWGRSNHPIAGLSTIAVNGPRLQGRVSIAGIGEIALDGAVNDVAVSGTFSRRGGTNDTGPLGGRVLGDAAMAKGQGFAAGAGWPSWRGPDGDDTAQETGHELVDDLRQARLVWFSEEVIPSGAGAELSGGALHGFSLFNSPVVGDGKLFFNTAYRAGAALGEPATREGPWTGDRQPILADEVVMAIDAASGKTLWRRTFKEEGVNLQGKKHCMQGGTGCYLQGKYYAVTSTLKLICCDAKTGAIAWDSDFGPAHQAIEAAKPAQIRTGRLFSPLTVYPILDTAEGIVFCHAGGEVFNGGVESPVFDAETGRKLWLVPPSAARLLVRWTHQGKEYLLSLPTPDAAGNAVTCFEPRTGQVVWRSTLSVAKGGPALHGDILVGSTDKTVTAWKLDGGGMNKIWELDGASEVFRFDDLRAWGGGPDKRSHGFSCSFYKDLLVLRWMSSYRRDEPAISKLAALDAASGRVVRVVPGLGASKTRHVNVVANDRLLTCHDAGNAGMFLRMLDLRNLAYLGAVGVEWKGVHVHTSAYDIPMAYPVVDGRIFFRGRERIYCYDLRKP